MTETIAKRNLLTLPNGFLVFLGGGLGALIRALLDTVLNGLQLGKLPLSTILVNVLGAFLMGILVTCWSAKRDSRPLWNRLKIALGTGFLGAFTTYSSFALAIARPFRQAVEAHSACKSLVAMKVATGGVGVVLAGLVGVAAGTCLAHAITRPGIGERAEQ